MLPNELGNSTSATERNKKIPAKDIPRGDFFAYLIVLLFSAERETLEVNNGQFLVG